MTPIEQLRAQQNDLAHAISNRVLLDAILELVLRVDRIQADLASRGDYVAVPVLTAERHMARVAGMR